MNFFKQLEADLVKAAVTSVVSRLVSDPAEASALIADLVATIDARLGVS